MLQCYNVTMLHFEDKKRTARPHGYAVLENFKLIQHC